MDEKESHSPAPVEGEIPPNLSYDAIALRAYFIALSRSRRGEESSPLHDWLEAETQLEEELKPLPPKG